MAPPASLAIQAGDNQEADAGSEVPVRLAAIVRDASSRPVPGVQVSFAVTAGGGSLASSEATTDATGVATAGAWTLGPVEGANAVTAQVTGLPAVTFRAQGKPVVRVVADTTLGPNGGTVSVSRPGDPANGVRLVVPPRAFSDATHLTISVLPPLPLTLPEGVSVVGPVLAIAGFPDRYADSLLTLRIPVALPAGSAAAAFLRDPTTGRLELAIPLGQDETTLTVATRHLSPTLMLNARTGAASRATASAVGGASVMQVVVVHALQARLKQQPISTGFMPGVDDWEFANYGSYISPDGFCVGQSITAIWYYLRKRPLLGPLWGKLDSLDALSWDNPRGFRFAGVVQQRAAWKASMRMLDVTVTAANQTGVPMDMLTFYTMALGMLVTREPQFVVLFNANEGHAVVAYAMDATHVHVADPNFPGSSQNKILFTGTTLHPYIGQSNAYASSTEYDDFKTVGTTTLMSTASLDALWSAVTGGTIGDDLFPAYALQYRDTLAQAWRPLPDTLRTRQSSLRIRAQCAACGGSLVGGTQPLVAYDGQGNVLSDATVTGVVNVSPPVGTSPLALYLRGLPNAAAPERYIDFQWRTIIRSPFAVQPATQTAAQDSVVRLTARPFGDYPKKSRYIWNFGDRTALATELDDSAVTHIYRQPGTFTVNVDLEDAANGNRVATASALVTVPPNDSFPIWRITRLTQQSVTGKVPHDDLAVHTNWPVYSDYFATRATLRSIAAGHTLAHIHALAAKTSMPDCFDFDFNGNKQEALLWPAWIWIQTPGDVWDWCGGADAVVGHSPGDRSFGAQWTSIGLGLRQNDYWALQGASLTFLYPDPDFAQVPANIYATGTIAGRHYAASYGCSGASCPNVYPVVVAHEIRAQITGKQLSGTLTFVYREIDLVTYAVLGTWTATWTFDAVRGR